MSNKPILTASGRRIVLLVILLIVSNFLLRQSMPSGLVLDLKFAYSSAEAYESLENMGEELRKDYLKCLLIFDIPYMLIYTSLFIQLFNLYWMGSKIRFLCFGPIVFDFFENATIYTMIQIFPAHSPLFGFGASFFTSVKWVAVAIVVGLILLGLFKRFVLSERQGLL